MLMYPFFSVGTLPYSLHKMKGLIESTCVRYCVLLTLLGLLAQDLFGVCNMNSIIQAPDLLISILTFL